MNLSDRDGHSARQDKISLTKCKNPAVVLPTRSKKLKNRKHDTGIKYVSEIHKESNQIQAFPFSSTFYKAKIVQRNFTEETC